MMSQKCRRNLGALLLLVLNFQTGYTFPSGQEQRVPRRAFPAGVPRPCSLKNHYFHDETRQCYEVDTQGPCSRAMVFVKIENPSGSVNGECHCRSYPRKLIYDPHSKICYPIFSQGPCGANDWLTLDPRTETFQCQMNPCLPKDTDFNSPRPLEKGQDFVLFNNRCVQLGSRDQECGPEQVVEFVEGKILPVCNARKHGFSLTVGGRPNCRLGTALSRKGKCTPLFYWR